MGYRGYAPEIEAVTSLDSRLRAIADFVEQRFGRGVVFYRSSDPRGHSGFYLPAQPDVIFVNADGVELGWPIAAHEFVHAHAPCRARELPGLCQCRRQADSQRDGMRRRTGWELRLVADRAGAARPRAVLVIERSPSTRLIRRFWGKWSPILGEVAVSEFGGPNAVLFRTARTASCSRVASWPGRSSICSATKGRLTVARMEIDTRSHTTRRRRPAMKKTPDPCAPSPLARPPLTANDWRPLLASLPNERVLPPTSKRCWATARICGTLLTSSKSVSTVKLSITARLIRALARGITCSRK